MRKPKPPAPTAGARREFSRRIGELPQKAFVEVEFRKNPPRCIVRGKAYRGDEEAFEAIKRVADEVALIYPASADLAYEAGY